MNLNIEQMDYLKYIKTLKNKSIDFICIDPPYGKINGMKLSGQKNKIDWDIKINWREMFEEFNRIIKDGGTIACFGQNPTYSEMILSNKKDYKYDILWAKNNAAQGFHSKKMPLIFTENIAIFIKKETKLNKRIFNNIAKQKEVDKNKHFCRWYSQQLFNFIGTTRRQIHENLEHRKLEFFFYYTGKFFGLLSKDLYNELIKEYKINKWVHFISYKELKSKWDEEKSYSKGIKLDGSIYSGTFTNILEIPKENKYLHPTQKPVKLMEQLVLMFSAKGDNILDCFMGSGSTGVAALKNKRNFFGSELNKKYFIIAKKRLKEITK